MKKILLTLLVISSINLNIKAQKFAYVDTDYILNKIPEFQQSQDILDNLSSDWQKEIEEKYITVEQMYREYQQDQVLLTDDMKTKREEAIIAKENSAKKLQQKYFGSSDKLIVDKIFAIRMEHAIDLISF